MRLYFKLSPTKQIVPFNYQYYLLGKLHHWLGQNEYHDKLSLYSFGWLSGGEPGGGGLKFKSNSNWFVSFWDEEMGKQLLYASMKDPSFIFGMNVIDITINETTQFTNHETFTLSSPILIRNYNDNKSASHLTFRDLLSDELMTATMKRKLSTANIDTDISIKFDRNYHNARTKLVTINGIENRANMCPIIVDGNPESIKFAWNVGVGHSTGSGFGAIN